MFQAKPQVISTAFGVAIELTTTGLGNMLVVETKDTRVLFKFASDGSLIYTRRLMGATDAPEVDKPTVTG